VHVFCWNSNTDRAAEKLPCLFPFKPTY
jgi:hypothetical protein